MVLFAFVDAGDTVTTVTESFTGVGVNATNFYFTLSHDVASAPHWGISVSGTKGTFTVTSGYTYYSANNTVKLASKFNKYNTTATIQHDTLASDAVSSVGVYAIIVFTMMAIIPLVVVGGVMLRSLGFFGGGGGGGKP